MPAAEGRGKGKQGNRGNGRHWNSKGFGNRVWQPKGQEKPELAQSSSVDDSNWPAESVNSTASGGDEAPRRQDSKVTTGAATSTSIDRNDGAVRLEEPREKVDKKDELQVKILEEKGQDLKRKLMHSGLMRTDSGPVSTGKAELKPPTKEADDVERKKDVDVVVLDDVPSQSLAQSPRSRPLQAPAPKPTEPETRAGNTPRASAPSPKAAEFDQRLEARQARFGKESDGTLAKSSAVIKRTSSSGSVGGATAVQTLATPNSSNEASPLSVSAPSSFHLPPPPMVPPLSSTPPTAAKSSDGARNKAGSVTWTHGGSSAASRPRGAAGVSSIVPETMATLESSTPSSQKSSVAPAASSSSTSLPHHVEATTSEQARPVLAPLVAPMQASSSKLSRDATEFMPGKAFHGKVIPDVKELPPLKERSVAKAASAAAMVAPRQSGGLKRVLDIFTEPPRKRPRLAVGDIAAWDAEYKWVFDWLEKHLPNERLHSKPGMQIIACTDEKLTELERAWQQLM